MANSKSVLEQMIRDKMKGNAVIVAVIADEAQHLDRKQAAKEFRPQVKRVYRAEQLEILSCNHPTMYQTDDKSLIYGVTDYMKEEDYFNRFLKACQGDNIPVFIGIKTTNLY